MTTTWLSRRGVLMALSMLSLACAAAVACWDDQQAPLGPPRLDASVQHDTGLAAVADTWIEQDVPNVNHGTSTILRIRLTGKNRALLRWDQQAIQQAVGADSLLSATLEITYSTPAFYWEQGAKSLFLYRLTQAWTEAGATWNCAVDEVPADGNQNCGGPTQWSMTAAPPIAGTITASFVVQNGSSGTVQLNVTGDVRAWLAGTATNHGWLIKKELENISGLAEFGSRESGTPPRLVLSILQADTSRPVIPEGLGATGPVLEIAARGTPGVSYHRNLFNVRFADSTSGVTIQSFLSQFNGAIVGGFRSVHQADSYYVVRIPDPGPDWAAIDSIVQLMVQRPGVERVSVTTFRALILRGRYPVDPQIAPSRSAWAQSSAAVWSWRAVRAPLAWGCENGLYGGRRPIVGLVDLYFDSVHTDLAGSVQTPVFGPPDSGMVPDSAPGGALERNHAIGVAGVVTARADNDSAGVGMVWQSRLRVYATRRQSLVARAELNAFAGMIEQAARDSVQLLNLSVGAGDAADTGTVNLIRRAVKRFLDSGANRLVIQATGNDAVQMSIASLMQSSDPRVTALDRALAQLHDTTSYRNKILFVTGVSQQGTRYFNSNVWTGGDMLAAPADSIRTLSGGSGMQWGFFTSFATPFVSGAAAQLWSFDSTLTGAEVKQLLMQGAQEPRIDPISGAMVTPAPVPNAGGAFLLDAYGALLRAARERGGSPACGYPVQRAVGGTDSVVFASGGSSQRTVRIPGMDADTEALEGLSLAQGGRLVSAALRTNSGNVRSVRFTHTGVSVGSPVAGARRFLERDTVDLQYPNGYATKWPTFLFRPGSSQPFDAFAVALGATAPAFGSAAAVSPAGTHVLTMTQVFTPGACDGEPITARADLVPVAGGSTRLVEQTVYFPCSGSVFDVVMSAAWSHDGRMAVLLSTEDHLGAGLVSRVTLADSSGAVRTAALGNVFLSGPRFSSDGVVVMFGAHNGGSCTVQTRLVSDLSLLSTVPGSSGVDCGLVPPVQNNVRVAQARQRSLDSVTGRVWHRTGTPRR